MSKEINVIASIPPIASAITLDGQGDGGKLKLDIPLSHIESIVRLARMSEQTLEVAICESDSANPLEIVFMASLPPIASAITVDGRGDGSRIKLDIPRSHVDKLVMLFSLTGTVLNLKIKETE